jgi:hypothetical protein
MASTEAVRLHDPIKTRDFAQRPQTLAKPVLRDCSAGHANAVYRTLYTSKQRKVRFGFVNRNNQLALARRDAKFEQLSRSEVRHGKSLVCKEQTEEHRLGAEQKTCFLGDVRNRKGIPADVISKQTS